jgi:hypothetical protein
MKAVGKFSTRPSLWQASGERRKRDSGFAACGYSADKMTQLSLLSSKMTQLSLLSSKRGAPIVAQLPDKLSSKAFF